MEKKVKYFLALYIIIEVVLILVGLIYIYAAAICPAGGRCLEPSDLWLEGFVFAIIFGIFAPIIFFIWYYLQKKKQG